MIPPIIPPKIPLRRALSLLLLAAASAPTATAQTTPPRPAAPTLVPGLGNITIANPSPAPTPTSASTPQPAPSATATPAPIVTPTVTAPRVRTTPNPPVKAAPTPPAPTPTPAISPLPAPVALATPESAPQATPAPPVVAATPPAAAFPTLGVVLAALALLALAGLAWFFLKRRREPEEREEIVTAPEAAPPIAPPLPSVAAPVPTPSPPPSFLRTAPVAHGPRAWIELGMRPVRAGTNLTSAAVDYEITLRNAGDVDATGIRIELTLISAAADQDAVLRAFFASPINRPAVAPFDLAADQQIALGGMAMAPREVLKVVAVQDRAIFVPMFALNVRYDWPGGQGGQTANAWVIGIERADGGKMQPFRLDAAPRMHDKVGQRPHSFAITD